MRFGPEMQLKIWPDYAALSPHDDDCEAERLIPAAAGSCLNRCPQVPQPMEWSMTGAGAICMRLRAASSGCRWEQ